MTENGCVEMFLYQPRHILFSVRTRNGVDDEYDTLSCTHSFANIRKNKETKWENIRNLMKMIKYLDFCSLFRKKCVILQSENNNSS